MTRACTFLTAVALLLAPGDLAATVTASQADSFAVITLPEGVSFRLGDDWTVLSTEQRQKVRDLSHSRLDLSDADYRGTGPVFAANLYDENGAILGLMNVRFYPELDVTQAEVRPAPQSFDETLDSALARQIRASVEKIGGKVISWSGTTRRTINGITVFVTAYRRQALHQPGTFRVRLVRTFAGERSNTLTVSYWVRRKSVVKPIADSIIASLQMTGISATTPSDASPGNAAASTSAAPDADSLIAALLVSLVITWGVGLAPPVFLRFVWPAVPFGRWRAIAVVGGLWMFNLLLFSAMGSQSRSHTALVFVAVVSYFILRKDATSSTSSGLEPG
jgi:hypothetical protein